MACLNKVCRFQHMNFQVLLSLRSSGIVKSLFREKSIALDIDVLDNFTTQLISKLSFDRGTSRTKNHLLEYPPKHTQAENDLKLTEPKTIELNRLFQDALDENDDDKIATLVSECIEHKQTPSVSVLTNLLYNFSHNGNVEGVKNVQILCADLHPKFLKQNSDFCHYLAAALWIQGHVLKAIEIFDSIHMNNVYLRRRIRLMLKNLIFRTVHNCSEAVLLNIIKFVEKLPQSYNDYYLLTYIWQVCFLSDWYADQCVALKLLESNEALRKAAMSQIPYVIWASLKSHRTEQIYKLLEVLLKYQLKTEYSTVLIALFDYRYRQGDLPGCLEIVHWSNKNDVTLPTIQHEKFLKLFLKYEMPAIKQKPDVFVPKYNMKF